MKAPRVVIIGRGADGLSAAYTLRKRGIEPLLLEADGWVGGRLRGEAVSGVHIDAGADFFCSSYDETFRVCRELRLDMKRSQMSLGWHSNGRWVMSYPIEPVQTFLASLDFLRTFGLLSPAAYLPMMKMVWGSARQA